MPRADRRTPALFSARSISGPLGEGRLFEPKREPPAGTGGSQGYREESRALHRTATGDPAWLCGVASGCSRLFPTFPVVDWPTTGQPLERQCPEADHTADPRVGRAVSAGSTAA